MCFLTEGQPSNIELVKSIDNGEPVTCAVLLDPNTVWAGAHSPLIRVYTGFQQSAREPTVRTRIAVSVCVCVCVRVCARALACAYIAEISQKMQAIERQTTDDVVTC